ncbi:AGAP010199-PA-like protein [Anopheles sinensis]|uniref:AGAP010199-PA-like protein n=1 Tax=Anopheles sinensis TaxID=74873 RepID=A0A084W614_ANOSI|nr:AGAP010199-PA-like protein [Anopheles sinensis]
MNSTQLTSDIIESPQEVLYADQHEKEPHTTSVTDLVFNIKRYDGPRNKKNEPSGAGSAKLINGDRYEGTFRKGLYHGSGVLKERTGHRYEGGFQKGLRNGRGTQTYPDRSSYCGDWRKGVRHGYGVYKYANGDCFEGNWCNGNKHGIGTYNFAENGLRLRGSWNAGMLAGPVEILFGDLRFHGTWNGTGLLDSTESVFNIGCKYLLRGVIRCGSFDEYVWSPSTIERYSFASLPLEPLPAPIPFMIESVSDCSDESETDSLKCV